MREVKQIVVTDERESPRSHQGPRLSDGPQLAGENLTDIPGADLRSHKPQ